MTKLMMTAAALLAFAAAAPATANAEPVTVQVSVAGLDLATSEGRAELAKRADSVARNACGAASDSDLRGKKVVRECRETVMTAAMRHAASQRLAQAGE